MSTPNHGSLASEIAQKRLGHGLDFAAYADGTDPLAAHEQEAALQSIKEEIGSVSQSEIKAIIRKKLGTDPNDPGSPPEPTTGSGTKDYDTSATHEALGSEDIDKLTATIAHVQRAKEHMEVQHRLGNNVYNRQETVLQYLQQQMSTREAGVESSIDEINRRRLERSNMTEPSSIS
eukprot:Clim_evm155s157 gene=Clim_evmTU155s157